MVDDCLFCKIIRREIPSKVAYEDDQVFAFYDIEPAAPVHVLFVPKKHVDSIKDVSERDSVLSILADRAVKTAEKLAVDQTGFRLSVNYGPDAGQTIHHLHLHLLAGGKLAHM